MNADIEFGNWGSPHIVVPADRIKHSPMWYHNQGLQQTASGYGSRLVQPWKVKHKRRWYRVYCVCWSNVGTNYINLAGERHVVNLY